MTTVYNIYLWDTCCHQFVSTDTGATFVESATPKGGNPATTTLGDIWSDAQMAINDADYLTFVASDSDFLNTFGIIAISTLAGTGTTFVLKDPEKSTTGVLPSPAFMPASDPQFGTDWQQFLSCAITAKAQIILACTANSSSSTTPFYPRISRDGGATWSDVTSGIPSDISWARAAFGASGTIMYLRPSTVNKLIYKSTDTGATWTELDNGPFNGTYGDPGTTRIRCSSDGQVIVTGDKDGTFWFSTDGGASFTSTDFTAIAGNPVPVFGGYGDCSVTSDGSTIIVSYAQQINGGAWPAVFVSTNSGASFTQISANLQYPASVGPPAGGAPGTNPTSCTGCNVAPDGLGMVVTFNYRDNPTTAPDGFPRYTTYVNVSVDGGTTFALKSFTADAFESDTTGLGEFNSVYILPFTAITPVNTNDLYYIERMTPVFDDNIPDNQHCFLDSCIVPPSVKVATKAGQGFDGIRCYGMDILTNLGSTTLAGVLGGMDIGDSIAAANGVVDFMFNTTFTLAYLQTFGLVTFPEVMLDQYQVAIDSNTQDGSSHELYYVAPFIVGFPYTSQGQLLRPNHGADAGSRTGPAMGKIRRNHWYAALLYRTQGDLTFSTDFTNLHPAELVPYGDSVATAQPDLFSGTITTTIDDDYSLDGMIAFQMTRPLPCTLVSISGYVETQDK